MHRATTERFVREDEVPTVFVDVALEPRYPVRHRTEVGTTQPRLRPPERVDGVPREVAD